MKSKNLNALSYLLASLALVTVLGVNLYLASLSGYVIVEKEVHYGDESVISGIWLEEKSYMGFQHFWDYSYSLEDPSDMMLSYEYTMMETDPHDYFHYRNLHLSRRLEVYDDHNLFYCHEDYNTREAIYTFEDSPNLAFEAVAGEVAEGEDVTEVVNFADYYDYYPYTATYFFHFDESNAFYRLSEASLEKLYSTIKAPVHQDHQLEIRVWDKMIFPEQDYECKLTAFDVGVEVIPINSAVVTEDEIYLLSSWGIAELPEGTTSMVAEDRSYETYVAPVLYRIPYTGTNLLGEDSDYSDILVELGDFQVVTDYQDKGFAESLVDLGEYLGVFHSMGLDLYHKDSLTLAHSIEFTRPYQEVANLDGAILAIGEEDGFYYEVFLEGASELRGNHAPYTNSDDNHYYYWTFNYFYRDGKLFHVTWLPRESNPRTMFNDILLHVYDSEGLAYSASYFNTQGQDINETAVSRRLMPTLSWG